MNIQRKHRVFNGKWLTCLPLPNNKTNTKIITKGAHAHAFINAQLHYN